MISTGWFVIAGIVGLSGILLSSVFGEFYINKGKEVYAIYAMISFIMTLLLVVFLIVVGSYSPDKMPVEYRCGEPDGKMVEEIVKKNLENMSVERKYEIMMKHEMNRKD